MSTLRYPSSTNFMPRATGEVVAYVRDPKTFALNRWLQWIPTPDRLGYFFKLDPDAPARIVTAAEFAWTDGANRPQPAASGMSFATVPFLTERYSIGFELGDMTVAAGADYLPLVQIEAARCAAEHITLVTYLSVSALETVATWGPNTDTVNGLNGGAGTWDAASDQPGTPTYNAIRKTLTQAAFRVNLATRGNVRPSDLVLVVSPGMAIAMANSAEVHNYMKFGPFSQRELEGKDNLNGAQWGLPPSIYGFEIVVEDAVRVPDRPNAAGTPSTQAQYIKGDSNPVLVSRKGGLDTPFGSRSFSTVQCYHYGPIVSVETFQEPKHRKVEGYTTFDVYPVIAAPAAGYLITSAL